MSAPALITGPEQTRHLWRVCRRISLIPLEVLSAAVVRRHGNSEPWSA